MAAVQSATDVPVHDVHTSTEGSDEKSSQQNPASMKVSKPLAHVAVVQSATAVPVHDVHTSTEGSDEKSLQHPVNGENSAPSHKTTG